MGGIGSGRKPRNYPPEVVEMAVGLYREGHTVREVQEAIGAGFRAQTILERFLPERRLAAKRNQAGSANHMWTTMPGYQAAHLRLGRARDHTCTDCGGPARHWSFEGCPSALTDPAGRSYCTHQAHYSPRCVRCHHIFDHRGRRADGSFLSREEFGCA